MLLIPAFHQRFTNVLPAFHQCFNRITIGESSVNAWLKATATCLPPQDNRCFSSGTGAHADFFSCSALFAWKYNLLLQIFQKRFLSQSLTLRTAKRI